jgi:hypothetical protein
MLFLSSLSGLQFGLVIDMQRTFFMRVLGNQGSQTFQDCITTKDINDAAKIVLRIIP